jgi:hypothetical protein
MGRNPMDHQAALEIKIFHTGRELTTPVLEDECERGDWWWVMEDMKHVIIVGEFEKKVLRLVPLHGEAVTRNVEAVSNQTMDVQQ